jgi:RHS repeat-associated protein
MTNASKAVVWRANNFAFDRTVAYDTIGGLKEGYPGQSYDAETGLWHNYMRDYDGLTGRYIESDPIGLGGGLNTYGYVGGNPVSWVDPEGKNWGVVGAVALGGAIGGVVNGGVAYLQGESFGDHFLSGAAGGALGTATLLGTNSPPLAGAVAAGVTSYIDNAGCPQGTRNMRALISAGAGFAFAGGTSIMSSMAAGEVRGGAVSGLQSMMNFLGGTGAVGAGSVVDGIAGPATDPGGECECQN